MIYHLVDLFSLFQQAGFEADLLRSKKWFGGANEVKKCLHFFASERRRQLAADLSVGLIHPGVGTVGP